MPITLPTPEPRDIFLNSEFDRTDIQKIQETLLKIENSDAQISNDYTKIGLRYSPKPIRLFITSYGGSVYPCLGLCDVIEKLKTPVHTMATGIAASCGLLLSLHGSKRFAYKKTTFVAHSVSNWMCGDIQGIKDNLEETERLNELIIKIITSKTKISRATFLDYERKRKDWYFDAKTALKLGVIDKIL